MVRTLYGDSLAWSNKENRNEPRPDHDLQLRYRLFVQGRLPLQSVHLQAVQLLTATFANKGAPAASRAGADFSRTEPCY